MSDARSEQIEARFGASAQAYADSVGHRGGADLDMLLELAELRGDERVLDVATGAGHTALAYAKRLPGGSVVAYDMAHGMLLTARRLADEGGARNIRTVRGSAESLPFRDGAFDVVTCRIAPHHFTDVGAFVRGSARALRRGGRFLVEDSLAPDDPEEARWLHEAELTRDPTHVRSLSEQGWTAVYSDNGFTVDHVARIPKRHDFSGWLQRGGCDEAGMRRVTAMFNAPGEHGRRFVELGADGTVAAFLDTKIILSGRR